MSEPIFYFNAPKVTVKPYPFDCSLFGVYLECVDDSLDSIDLSCPLSLLAGSNLHIEPDGVLYFIWSGCWFCIYLFNISESLINFEIEQRIKIIWKRQWIQRETSEWLTKWIIFLSLIKFINFEGQSTLPYLNKKLINFQK